MQVSIKLEEILKKRRMTQKELASLAGIRESTISEIVRNSRTAINKEHLCKIAEVLEISDIGELLEFK